MKKNTCFELPSSRGVQKCIVYPPPWLFWKKVSQPPQLLDPPPTITVGRVKSWRLNQLFDQWVIFERFSVLEHRVFIVMSDKNKKGFRFISFSSGMVLHETTTNVLRPQNNNKRHYSQTLHSEGWWCSLRVIKTSETIGFVRSTKGHSY